MKEVNLKLGLAEEAEQAQVLEAVTALQDENTALKAKLTTAFEKLGEATGAITDKNRERMMKLAATDFDLALSFLEPSEKKEEKKEEQKSDLRLSDLIKELKGTKADTPEKDYDWYQKNDPAALLKMKHEEPEKFQKLFDEFYTEKA